MFDTRYIERKKENKVRNKDRTDLLIEGYRDLIVVEICWFFFFTWCIAAIGARIFRKKLFNKDRGTTICVRLNADLLSGLKIYGEITVYTRHSVKSTTTLRYERANFHWFPMRNWRQVTSTKENFASVLRQHRRDIFTTTKNLHMRRL